jgi:hypothetical protein
MSDPVVQHRLTQRRQPTIVEQARFGQPAQVEDPVPDRAADARPRAVDRENAEREVLDRKIGMAVGACFPARAGRIMGFVDAGHFGNCAFGKSAQAAS